MPHSSGGGSHSGGSHSGGGGGGSFGGGGGSSVKTQSSYFRGSYRYVRYHDGKADYIYSSSKHLSAPTPKLFKIIVPLFYVPFFIAGFTFIVAAFKESIPPSKLKPVYNEISIVDSTDRFTTQEENELYTKLYDFREKTGIPVTVMTTSNPTWKNSFDNLSLYAYETYLNIFFDESHWLIIYSDDLSDRQDIDNFNDWYFEGMQGDDTDKILTFDVTTGFNEDLTKLLYNKSNTTGYAFIQAFEDINHNVMKSHINLASCGIAFFWNAFIVGHFLLMMRSMFKNERKYKDYILCPDEEGDVIHKDASFNEVKCDYCGGVYYRGTVTECPHCGAPIKTYNEIIQHEDSIRRIEQDVYK